MKKTLSVILATIILVMSVFSVNAFAAETTKTEALLAKLNDSQEVAVTLGAGDIAIFGKDSDSKDIIYIKDDKAAYEYNAGFLSVRVVLEDDEIIAFFPAFPYIHVKLDTASIGSVDIWELIEKATDITMGILAYVDTYAETVDGKTYTVEEFNDRAQVTSKFYYEGDHLKILKVEDKQYKSVQYTYFDNIEFSVDDSIFELPLISFDLTPILKGVFIALLGSTFAV